MHVYLLDLDKIPYGFYDHLKNMGVTDARWLNEKKFDLMAILEKFKIPKIDYMPIEQWTCVYCKSNNVKNHNSCQNCGAPINRSI